MTILRTRPVVVREESFYSYVAGDLACMVAVQPVPAPAKKQNTAAIAGGVIAAVFVIGVLAILAALWKIRDLQTDIALLDDFACTDNIKASPLYDHQGIGGTNALYEAC